MADEDRCTTGGGHEPDFSRVRLEPDGEWYVDVPCGVCEHWGSIGSLELLVEMITWE